MVKSLYMLVQKVRNQKFYVHIRPYFLMLGHILACFLILIFVLYTQFRDTGSSEDEFCKGYEDYLQCPLQVSINGIILCTL